MNHFAIRLSLFALIPGIFLCGYVFYKDRVEKEPISLLALLFGAGAVAYVPAYFLQDLVINLIDNLFSDSRQFTPEGLLRYTSTSAELLHTVLCAFIGFSLIQIVLKWVVLFFGTHKNKNFNYLFDGVVYSVFLALGFAVAEVIHFAFMNDAELTIAKLLTSVPCHLFISVLMGYYYTMWRMRFLVNGIENKLLANGFIKEDKIRSSAVWLIGSLAVPVAVSTLYSVASSSSDRTVTMIFYFVVCILYGLSFIAIHQLASRESSSASYLCRVIMKAHPEVKKEDIEACMAEQEGAA